jgi:hypothetical protein
MPPVIPSAIRRNVLAAKVAAPCPTEMTYFRQDSAPGTSHGLWSRLVQRVIVICDFEQEVRKNPVALSPD